MKSPAANNHDQEEVKSRVTRATQLNAFLLSLQNRRSFWACEVYVNTDFALRQFRKVFRLPESVVHLMDSLIETYVEPTRVGVAALGNDTNASCESSVHVSSVENGHSGSNQEALSDVEEEVNPPSPTDSSTLVGNTEHGWVHDFPSDFVEVLLKLMLPCSRRHFLMRLQTVVGKALPRGIPNPLGEDKYNVNACSMPPEVRLFILASAVELRIAQDSSQNVDEDHPPEDLRPLELGTDTAGNRYVYFYDSRVWCELKKPPKYKCPAIIDSDEKPWEWAFELVTSRCGWLCIADFEEDATSWDRLLTVLNCEPKLARKFENLHKKTVPLFREELARREAERLRREKEAHVEEMKRLRELSQKFATEDVGGYGLRVSARLRAKQPELEERRRKELEDEDLLDDALGIPRSKRGRYEKDDDFVLDESELSRERRPARVKGNSDPSHGLSREERMAVREARAHQNYSVGEDEIRAASSVQSEDVGLDNEESTDGSSRRQVEGIGLQGELSIPCCFQDNGNQDDQCDDQSITNNKSLCDAELQFNDNSCKQEFF